MGEREEGGMLRTVIILGLIALIAGALIASITVLRGKMDSRNNATNDSIQNAIAHANDSNGPTGPVLATDNVATANAKLKNILAISKDNEKVNDGNSFYKHPAYSSSIEPLASKTKWSIANGDTNGDTSRVDGNTLICESMGVNGTNGFYTPMIQVPASAKTMTLTYDGQDIGNMLDFESSDGGGDSFVVNPIGIGGGSSSITLQIHNGKLVDVTQYGDVVIGSQFVIVFSAQMSSRGTAGVVPYKATLSNVQVTFS